MCIRDRLTPDYIFEASWEVCNKVGGIYTVLSTRANTLQTKFRDRLFFIGPDFWQGKENPLFIESDNLCAAWKKHAALKDNLSVRVGRWNIPGEPIVILVDFQPFFAEKNEIYTEMWNRYQVDSLHGYGDYDEASMFAFATGKVIESFYRYNLTETDKVVFQAHEWMTGMAALYLQSAVPEIGTIFTTHATSIGRSIAGNNKPLYDYLFAYNGDQMARELNMESKHSLEKAAAHTADCFTTVSDITAAECEQLLDRRPDIVTPNGFQGDLAPVRVKARRARITAREALLNVAKALTGHTPADDTFIVATSGRCEYRNKGIDVFLDSIKTLESAPASRPVLAFVLVPAWMKAPRADLQARLAAGTAESSALGEPTVTHELHNTDSDAILGRIRQLGFASADPAKVQVVYVPSYLNGDDGIFNMDYYEILCGLDATAFPSYYEPWGYTPLESVAFGIPTITTSLSGFGQWILSSSKSDFAVSGVEVVQRLSLIHI